MTSTTDHTPEYLSPEQAAAILGVHRQTIYKAIRERRLAHHKLSPGARGHVRLTRDDLEAWLAASRIDAR